MPPRFKINSQISLERAIAAAWKRVGVNDGGSTFDSFMHVQVTELLRITKQRGWDACKEEYAARQKIIEHTNQEATKICDEAWRRNGASRHWHQANRLSRCLNKLENMFDEAFIWLNSGGVLKLEALWVHGKLVNASRK